MLFKDTKQNHMQMFDTNVSVTATVNYYNARTTKTQKAHTAKLYYVVAWALHCLFRDPVVGCCLNRKQKARQNKRPTAVHAATRQSLRQQGGTGEGGTFILQAELSVQRPSRRSLNTTNTTTDTT